MVIHIGEAELEVILPLRAEVLRDGQPREDADFESDGDANTLHLVALEENGDGYDVVGCVSLMVNSMSEDPAWTHQLRGMAVAESHRSQGVGEALLQELDRRTPKQQLWCNARVPAQRFYERHGWTAVSEPFDVPHHGPHVGMRRTDIL